MALTEAENKWKKIGCIFGIIEGLTWEILSFICIVMYLAQIDHLTISSSYMESIGEAMYALFIVNSGQQQFDGQVFTKDVFFAFMLFHLIANTCWVGASAFLLKKTYAKSVLVWSYVTLAVALLDFITLAMFGSDYDKCLAWAKDIGSITGNDMMKISLEGQCANVILPVFVIAAKGFTLWVINITLGVTMWRIGRRMK